jgi:hypothetical protein
VKAIESGAYEVQEQPVPEVTAGDEIVDEVLVS